MSALEDEILERFQKLDRAAKARLLDKLHEDAEIVWTHFPSPNGVTPGEWLQWATAFGAELEAKYGSRDLDSVQALHEAREERLNDLMGRR